MFYPVTMTVQELFALKSMCSAVIKISVYVEIFGCQLGCALFLQATHPFSF